MQIFPDHPDLKVFNNIVIFLFTIGLADIFYIFIKSNLLKRNVRTKEHSWHGYWSIAIISWLFIWGVYILDQVYGVDLIR